MTYVSRILVLLIVGLFMMSASASADDRLTVSGSLMSQMIATSNQSAFDDNFTSLTLDHPFATNMQAGDQDDMVLGISRLVFTFNVEAFENTKLVWTIFADQFWGEGGAAGRSAWRPDNYNEDALRLHGNLYVDLLIPNTAATLRVGAFSASAQRLKGCMIHCVDTMGAAITAPFSDTVNTYTWYSVWSDNWDGVAGINATTGAADDETWAMGTRIEFTPMDGLDVDLIYVYQRLGCSDPRAGGTPTGGCSIRTLQLRNAAQAVAGSDEFRSTSLVAGEDRNWVGLDVRYQYGDFTFSPTAIFHFGSTDLMGGGESDLSSFLLDVEAAYQVNPALMLKGRVGYTPGNPASDALGDGSTLNSWQIVGTYVSQPSLSWFTLWGYNNIIVYPFTFDYATGRAIEGRMSFDQFGLMIAAARAEYQVNEKTLITGSLGVINTAEKVGRPARLGPSTVSDADHPTVDHRHDDAAAAVTTPDPAGVTQDDHHKITQPNTVANNPTFNYTGQDTHLATEIDVELAYTLNPSTTLKLWAAYSLNGDAMNLMDGTGAVSEAKDTVGGGATLVYSF